MEAACRQPLEVEEFLLKTAWRGQSSRWMIALYLDTEMEKDGHSGRAASANFSQLFFFVFFTRLIKGVCLFCAFLQFLHDLGHCLHIFCVQIFQNQSFAGSIL